MVVLAAMCLVWAAAAPPSSAPPRIVAVWSAPSIDGVLDSGEWELAQISLSLYSLEGVNTSSVPGDVVAEIGVALSPVALCFGLRLCGVTLPYHNVSTHIEASLSIDVDDGVIREPVSGTYIRGDSHIVLVEYSGDALRASAFDSCFVRPYSHTEWCFSQSMMVRMEETDASFEFGYVGVLGEDWNGSLTFETNMTFSDVSGRYQDLHRAEIYRLHMYLLLSVRRESTGDDYYVIYCWPPGTYQGTSYFDEGEFNEWGEIVCPSASLEFWEAAAPVLAVVAIVAVVVLAVGVAVWLLRWLKRRREHWRWRDGYWRERRGV